VQYRAPVRDARFVEDGKAIYVQPTLDQDPTLLWETEPLLDAQRVTAPTLQELGLSNNPQLAGGVKAVQRKDVKGSSATSSIAPPTASTSSTPPWQWARLRGEVFNVILSPQKRAALLVPHRFDAGDMRLIDLTDGRMLKNLSMPAIDAAQSLALDGGH
jgi:hypothetical protein